MWLPVRERISIICLVVLMQYAILEDFGEARSSCNELHRSLRWMEGQTDRQTDGIGPNCYQYPRVTIMNDCGRATTAC